MEEKLINKTSTKAAILLLTATYFISYITRNSYNVMITEMVYQTNISEASLSLAVTGSFITYGFGQIISGYFGDRFQPKNLVFFGLMITILMNGFIPLCKTSTQFFVVWCINGLAQSLLWPPIVRLMTYQFSGEVYQKATISVIWGGSFGNVVLYLIAPVLISFLGWRSMFWTAAISGIIMVFFWQKYCPVLPKQIKTANSEKNKNLFKMPLLWFIILAIILQGFLRDGVTTWMPVYISQTYNLGSTISILTGVVLPLFHLGCIQIAGMLHRRFFRNLMTCAGVLFGAGAFFSLILSVFPAKNVAVSVILSSLLTGCMHGVNLMLICMLPSYFKKYGNVSFLSGILNACVYIGSAISAYGMAATAERSGWQTVISCWTAVAAAGMLICLMCISSWKRFQNRNN